MSQPAIEARDLTKFYGDTVGVESLNLVVQPGEVFGFLGPNGAGKTTTIRLLLDLIRPTRGEARLFGVQPRDARSRISVGYLPGELALDERLTGQQMLLLLDALRRPGTPATNSQRRAELCERLRFTSTESQRLIRDMSRGMKQKVGLIAAFQHDPDLLILDEPTTSLDPLVREAVFELLIEAGRAGRTVFHSSHVLTEVDRTCTRVGILREGHLIAVHKIADMRRAAVRKMVVRFRGPVPVGELETTGAQIIRVHDNEAELRVSGELDPLLQVLAAHSIQDLAFQEADLEDAFVRYYTDDAAESR